MDMGVHVVIDYIYMR